MMRVLVMRSLLLFSILAISACDTGGGNNSKKVTNSIFGAWLGTHPATQCNEAYIFGENYEFTATALDKEFSGTYTYFETVSVGERHELIMYVLEDNEQTDCSGRNTNLVDTSVPVYAFFSSPDTVQFYPTKNGGDFLIELNKLESN